MCVLAVRQSLRSETRLREGRKISTKREDKYNYITTLTVTKKEKDVKKDTGEVKWP